MPYRVLVVFFIVLFMLYTTHTGNADKINDYIELVFRGEGLNDYAIVGGGSVGNLFRYEYSSMKGENDQSNVFRLSLSGLGFTANMVGDKYLFSYDNAWGGDSWDIRLSLRKDSENMDNGEIKIRKEW